MTREAFLKEVRERIAEERADVQHYAELAKQAEALGEDRAAWFLRQIRHDEKTHAQALEDIADEMGA